MTWYRQTQKILLYLFLNDAFKEENFMKILLADDHSLFREGLAIMLRNDFPTCKIWQVSHWQDAQQWMQRMTFDLVILDIFMPRRLSWEEELQYLLQYQNTAKVCMLSASNERTHMQTVFKLGGKRLSL